MATYFVDPFNGDDGNDGLHQASAFRSIDRGTQGLVAGDELQLHAWSIHGPTAGFSDKLHGKEAQDGQPAVPIVIRPYAGAEAVIDGRMRTPDTRVVPNTEWEQVPGGHAEEWRTRQVLDGPVRHGAFVDARIRLISYSRIEDLRATNESFRAVPLSDPREAGGPLVDDPTRKQPWTYFGPGLHWFPEHADDPDDPRGRVHVRLSPTHLGAAGTRDHAGPSDPNQVALALTPEDRTTVVVASSNIELRNLVIANGGETTLQVTDKARNVTFDHCTVYGARQGVRISGAAEDITFTHCTFDGGLAPWTVRSDVKNEYSFIDDDGRTAENGTGRRTHAHLVISGAPGARFAHCAFRRAHDALLLGGKDVRVHHCLFEDCNDEVVQFDAPTDAHVYKNLFRQVLHPFSFALKPETGGGPVFIYRNVIDQRLPTRGYRALHPDAPGPYIFRYGAGYKTGHKMPGVYVYQNTFVAADRDDKATALSLLFARSDHSADAPRVHLNNLLVGLDLDLPYTWLATPSALRRSDGNLWYAPQRDLAALALFRRADGSVEKVRTVARMHEIGAELTSRFTEPMLVNFDDEIFDHGRYFGDDHPNNDWRPAPGSPARAAGVPLPDDLEDPDRPEGSIKPDIGACVVGGPPLRVGVDDEVEQPAPNAPIARAGPDQLVTDTDDDGFASVTISGSTIPVGTIASHVWTSRHVTVATGPTATLILPEGDHYLRLSVTNLAGQTDTDGLRVRIRPPTPHGDNLVRNGGFEDDTAWQVTGASIVTGFAHTGRRALRLDAQAAVARQRIPVTPACRYKVSAWVRRASLFQPASMRVTVAFLDRNDVVLATTGATFPAPVGHAYRQTVVVAPEKAVAMDLVLGGNVTGRLFADDVRVLDDNLLNNAGFETVAPSGLDKDVPGWRFEAGGGRLVTEPVNCRSGTRALALEGTPADYRQVTQEIRTLTGATRYRITAWLKTVDLTAAPTMSAAFDDGSDPVIAEETSDGVFKLIDRELDAPPGAERLTLRLRLERGASGTAYFDDLLVVPLP